MVNIVILCTVSVDGRLNVNVALNRPSYESSSYYDPYTGITFYARYANDGNHNPHLTLGPCAHTELDTNPWWAVDLGVALYVAGVKFTNRDDSCTYFISSLIIQLTYLWPTQDADTMA